MTEPQRPFFGRPLVHARRQASIATCACANPDPAQ